MEKSERSKKRIIDKYYMKHWGFSPLFETGAKTVKPKLRKALKLMGRL